MPAGRKEKEKRKEKSRATETLDGIGKMKIIITGSEGYIGKRLQERLKQHEEVLNLDIKTGDDITKSLAKYIFFKPDVIFHLAALTSVEDSFKNPKETFRTNVWGTNNIMKLGGKIIFPSSATVYGNKRLAKEENNLEPQSPYAESKAVGEYFVQYSGLHYTILRMGNVIGGEPTRVLKALKEGGKIFGDGTHTRDYIHIEDVLDAMIMAIDWEDGIYNIGTGIETSVNQLADMMGVKKEYAPAKEEQDFISLDISKASQKGWYPKNKLENYVKRLAKSN